MRLLGATKVIRSLFVAITLVFGCSLALAATLKDVVHVGNDYLQIAVAPLRGETGRFSLGIYKDVIKHPPPLLDGHYEYRPRNNYLTVEVNRHLHPERDVWYEFGGGDGKVEIAPAAHGNKIICAWQTHKDKGLIYIEQKLTLLRDTMRLEYRVRNNDLRSHRLRLRLILDLQFGAPIYDGGTFATPTMSGIRTERRFVGAEVPSYWIAWGGKPTAPVILRGTLRGAGATPPDYMAFVHWHSAHDNYEYEINPFRDVTSDSGVVYWWGPFDLRPGEERRFVTYFGLGYTTSDFEEPYVLAVEAPPDLAADQKEFEVRAYVFNVSDLPLHNVSFFLSLPQGLDLSTGETSTKSLGRVDELKEGKVSWRVRPTWEKMGTLTFTVSAVVTPGGMKVVRREVCIPAKTKVSLVKGTQMIALPFRLPDPDLGRALDPGGVPLRFARWNPLEGSYRFYPDPFLANLQPGQAFWVRAEALTTLSALGATSLPPDAEVLIPVERGWNQIGCPFIYSVPWGMVEVYYMGRRKSLTEAIREGWIRSTIFWFDPEQGSYLWSSEGGTPISPWRGYWVRVAIPCHLIFPPPRLIPYMPEKEVLDAYRVLEGWAVALCASQGERKDSLNLFGASPVASDGLDASDVEEPPPPPSPSVTLRFVRKVRGEAVALAQDIVREADKMHWLAEVKASEEGEVVLSWPDLRKAPKELAFTLTDLTAGRKVWMRTTSKYRYKSRLGELRPFLIEAERLSGRGRLILGVSFSGLRSPSPALGINLGHEAMVTVRILTPTGRAVATPVRRKFQNKGMSRVLLQGAPRGVFLIEVVAEDALGRVERRVIPAWR